MSEPVARVVAKCGARSGHLEGTDGVFGIRWPTHDAGDHHEESSDASSEFVPLPGEICEIGIKQNMEGELEDLQLSHGRPC